MKDMKNIVEGLEIEELNISDMVNNDQLSEEDASQIMGASCTTCTCTCSCCTT
mgnify:CR=1 FL=1